MEIWRKLQIANVVFAVVAIVLSVVAFNAHNVDCWAMWAWSITLCTFMFLVPMPVIERNKKGNTIAYALTFFLAVVLAATINTWLKDYPTESLFSRSMLVYIVAYTVLALLLAAWLKIKEKRKIDKKPKIKDYVTRS